MTYASRDVVHSAHLAWSTQLDCYPPNHQAQYNSLRSESFIPAAYYSPGTCPDGYTAACPEDTRFMDPDQFATICCPR